MKGYAGYGVKHFKIICGHFKFKSLPQPFYSIYVLFLNIVQQITPILICKIIKQVQAPHIIKKECVHENTFNIKK